MFGLGAAVIEATREAENPREKGRHKFIVWREQWRRIAVRYSAGERGMPPFMSARCTRSTGTSTKTRAAACAA